jgi:hypothetical protein
VDLNAVRALRSESHADGDQLFVLHRDSSRSDGRPIESPKSLHQFRRERVHLPEVREIVVGIHGGIEVMFNAANPLAKRVPATSIDALPADVERFAVDHHTHSSFAIFRELRNLVSFFARIRERCYGRLMPNAFIRELIVEALSPSIRAAPLSPETRQPQVSSART